MKRAWSVWLPLLVITLLAGGWWGARFDKHGFYRQYFRIIEEINTRNSQDIADFVAIASSVTTVQKAATDRMFLLTGATWVGFSLFPPSEEIFSTGEGNLLRLVFGFWLETAPTRAP